MKCAEALALKPSREGLKPDGRDYRLGSREPGPPGRGTGIRNLWSGLIKKLLKLGNRVILHKGVNQR